MLYHQALCVLREETKGPFRLYRQYFPEVPTSPFAEVQMFEESRTSRTIALNGYQLPSAIRDFVIGPPLSTLEWARRYIACGLA